MALAGAWIAAACGGGGESADGPEPRLEATWTGGVAEVLRENCVTCHRPGGSGPFPLVEYDSARARAALIAEVTGRRYMPPWRPSRPVGVFANERRLEEEEIALLRSWAEAGGPRGDGRAPPPARLPSGGWQLGEPDVVLEVEGAYRLGAGGDEEFRNFVLPVPIEAARWVEAVEFLPGDPRVVHHATLAVDATGRARKLDTDDDRPGYEAMGAPRGVDPPGFFVGWTPGKVPDRSAPGVSWRLEPGTDIVTQLHLRPIAEPLDVRPRVGLHFADARPRRLPVVVSMGSDALDIPAGEPAYEVTDSFVLSVDVEVLELYPHAHYLGDVVQAWAEKPDGEKVWLLEIPEWDFNWQDSYRLEEPLPLPAGTTLRLRYLYDNTDANPLNPNTPPKDVTFGPRSVDEMADLLIQVLPRSPAESARLQREAGRKKARIHVEGLEAALARDGDDPVVHYNMGIAQAAMGRLAEAAHHLREAVRLDPSFAGAHNNLGIALHRQGEVAEAVEHFRKAVELDGGDPRTHHNLGMALLALGPPAEAEASFRSALRVDDGFARAHERLADVLRRRGATDEAERHYRRALELTPDDPDVHLGLGALLQTSGRLDEAVTHLEEAVRLSPRSLPALLALSELLARHPDPRARRPADAVALAERAVDLTGGDDPRVLLALGTAYASAGDPAGAVAVGERALAIARGSGAADLAQVIEQLLAAWSRGGR